MQGKKQFRNSLLHIIARAATAALAMAVVLALTVVLTQSAQAQSPATGGIWTEKVLHSFGSINNDGAGPYAGLIFDAAGNLYGTTGYGGTYNVGTVFELTPNGSGGWTEQVLHSFGSINNDGAGPYAGLIFDAAGNLYGTTTSGGTYSDGTVFKLTPTTGGGWTEQVLHNFNGDGYDPRAGLIFDATGNLYGMTEGGNGDYPDGTVFELTPTAGEGWTAKVLHGFNGADGLYPWLGSLIFDGAGDLYGTTLEGGTYGAGVVFELMPAAGGSWTETVLHSFNDNGTDGALPAAGLIFDAAGNLYGTTNAGGTYDAGTVFKLAPTGDGSWTETVLHNFGNGTDGALPAAGLIFDAAGNLYGTTEVGGFYGDGTVFELTPNGSGGWTEQVLFSFNLADGWYPYAGLILDAAGNLYGTTYTGGTYTYGTVFELTPVYPCAKCSHSVLR
ncbi:MAG: choice-of-anchor tandem repeat GloVer-containing protein [Candidatus Korobacteraceae bacterium]|jgi:uncharacterized repeat protein (TIGR03803 family)